MPRLPWLAVCGLLLVGCGSKTDLLVPTPSRDSGVADAPMDARIDAPMPPPDAGPDAAPMPDECIELPFEEPPELVDVDFEARILAADILFLVDTTGSMSDEINQIQRTLQEVLVPRMADAIPDVRFAVASFADFPVNPYGADLDRAYVMHQTSTSDILAVQRAIDAMPDSNGSDGPESQTEALFQSATGLGRGRFVAPATCPGGTVGYACFRPTGSRIFLLFTDAPFHNGPGGSNPYGPEVEPRPATYEETVNSLRDIGAKVLGLFSGGGDFEALRDLRAIARDTGAVAADGAPVVIDIGPRGELLDEGVIGAVETLVEQVPIDIDVLVEDADFDDFDVTTLVREVLTLRAEPPSGATDLGDRFENVLPGTRVFFRIMLQNDVLPPSETSRSFYLRIVLRGDGATRLQETLVQIIIPGERGERCPDEPLLP